jgi:triacylglycerol esterase/lipase EstA (alpha/beta hydrolase family)
LPTLILHYLAGKCDTGIISQLNQTMNAFKYYHQKDIYLECMDSFDDESWEPFLSLWSNAEEQLNTICNKIKKHPIFGKSDFNLIGLSQGGLLARSLVEMCDLGEYKVRNLALVGSPQAGV